MNKQNTLKEYIEGVLKASRFAVLATEGDGQPHASLIAITPLGNYRQLIFATYRNTAKYRNLEYNSKVAVLIESGDVNIKSLSKTNVLTITGHTEEISRAENEEAFNVHLKEHPELKSLMLSSDCAIFLVIAQSYQVVSGVDDVRWITAEDFDSN